MPDDATRPTPREDDDSGRGAPLNPFGSVVPAPRNAAAAMSQSREVAKVQGAMIVGHMFPRDEVVAMDKILNAFTRPNLAESALYEYSRGGSDVTGLSIRAAEAIAQLWGHIHMGVRELDQRDGFSTMEAFAFDAQTGTHDERTFQVKHWRDTKRGGYKIEDSRDIYELTANLAARRKRACILTVIPGDVQDAVKRQVELTLRSKVEITPELIKSLETKFKEFGVTLAMIEKRIQRRIDSITPGQVVQLGKIWNSLNDHMSNPVDWFEMDGAGTQATTSSRSGSDALKAAAARTAAADGGQGAEKAADADKANAKAPPKDNGFSITEAEVAAQIDNASDADEFNLAIDLIKNFAGEAKERLQVKATAARDRLTK